jgi:hypothetical protein
VRSIKLIPNWYRAHLRRFGIKWKWKGKGFIVLDGVSLVNQLRLLKVLNWANRRKELRGGNVGF